MKLTEKIVLNFILYMLGKKS